MNNTNINQYNTDINSTRNQSQNGLNINQNPYINQNVNPVLNQNTNQAMPNNTTQNQSFFNADFVKGALIGAVATYFLTNKNAQENIFNLFSKANEFASAGIEELKERMEDAKAAMEARKEEF
jgi:hypothetical protein